MDPRIEAIILNLQAFEKALEKERQERIEREKALEAERIKREAALAQERQEREAALEQERQEREKVLEAERIKREAALAQERQEREKANKAFDKQIKILNKKLSEITDTLGRFAEHHVRRGALKLFQRIGIPVHQVTFGFKHVEEEFYLPLYEIDVLLYNENYIVPIEVKSTLKKEHIDEHLERIKKMLQIPPRGVKGTRIIGAVAAMNAAEDAITYAIKKGFYVLLPNGKNVSEVNAPDFTPTYWDVN